MAPAGGHQERRKAKPNFLPPSKAPPPPNDRCGRPANIRGDLLRSMENDSNAIKENLLFLGYSHGLLLISHLLPPNQFSQFRLTVIA